MMEQPMTLEKARQIAGTLAHARQKYGKYAVVHFTDYEIISALIMLEQSGNWDAPTRDELTKANRQLAALNARHEKLKQKCAGGSRDDE